MTDHHSPPSTADDGLVLAAQSITLQMLPVELLAEIFSELDLDSLIVVSCLSRRFRAVTAEVSLNPWRCPILRNLHQRAYERSLFHLSVHSIVPRQNWIDILTFASPRFLLFDSTLPNLKSSEWEDCFRRRFLPGWTKWKKDNSWRETFMKWVLFHLMVLPSPYSLQNALSCMAQKRILLHFRRILDQVVLLIHHTHQLSDCISPGTSSSIEMDP